MALGQFDDLAKELLVDLPEDVGGEDGELVGAVRIVEPAQHVAQKLVVDVETEGQRIGRLVAVLAGLEVEEAGVVAVIGLLEPFAEPSVDAGLVGEGVEALVGLDAAILADAEEDDPVDDALDGEVEFALRQGLVPQSEVGGEIGPPLLDLFQKGGIDLGGAALVLVGLGELVEGALEDRFLGEDGGDVVPLLGELAEGAVEDAADGRLVGLGRFEAAVVDGELLEVAEDAQGQLGAPGITTELEGGCDVFLDVDARFLGFEEELPLAADTEAVIGCLDGIADADGVLVDDITVGLGVSGGVVDIPTKGLEERIEEIAAELGLVVLA